MKQLFNILAIVFAVLFVWAAYLQYNDPDAFTWYIIYGLAAFNCILFVARKLHYSIPALLGLAYLVAAFFFWPEQFEGVSIGDGNIDNIEHAREALGLIITALVMFVLSWRSKHS